MQPLRKDEELSGRRSASSKASCQVKTFQRIYIAICIACMDKESWHCLTDLLRASVAADLRGYLMAAHHEV